MMSRIRVQQAVANAIRQGVLVRPANCSACGQEAARIEGHHDDYSRPLDVIWLCQPCHRARHKRLGTGSHGRPRCIGCGHVVFLHSLENGNAVAFKDGIVHKRCQRLANGRLIAVAKKYIGEARKNVA